MVSFHNPVCQISDLFMTAMDGHWALCSVWKMVTSNFRAFLDFFSGTLQYGFKFYIVSINGYNVKFNVKFLSQLTSTILQCFDTAGWLTGKHTACEKNSTPRISNCSSLRDPWSPSLNCRATAKRKKEKPTSKLVPTLKYLHIIYDTLADSSVSEYGG